MLIAATIPLGAGQVARYSNRGYNHLVGSRAAVKEQRALSQRGSEGAGMVHAGRAGAAVAWACACLALVANIAGYAVDLYQRWWWFDRALHGFTLFALTLWLALFCFMTVIQPQQRCNFRTFLLIISVGIAAGALWEVFEWAADQVAAANVIKGKHDTILDIIIDSAGAVLAAIVALWLSRDGTSSRQ